MTFEYLLLNTADFWVCILLVGIQDSDTFLDPKDSKPVIDILIFCHQRIPKNRNSACLQAIEILKVLNFNVTFF